MSLDAKQMQIKFSKMVLTSSIRRVLKSFQRRLATFEAKTVLVTESGTGKSSSVLPISSWHMVHRDHRGIN